MNVTPVAGFLVCVSILAACNKSSFAGSSGAKDVPVPIQQPQTPPSALPAIPAAPAVRVTPAVVVTPSTLPENKPDVPSKVVEFGATEVFRIGDGYASDTSSCVGQVKTYKLSGTTYHFQFEVLEDDTLIDLTIGRICGVDQIDKDTFALMNDTTSKITLAERALPKLTDAQQATPWAPYPTFKLAKGLYSVVIMSKNIYGHAKVPGVAPDPSKDEYDDFLVGNILLKTTKAIRSVKIYTE
ncbi:MAG: hypothetical protein H7249_00130 [Chitinophagaceae bacterium]|nr:hypothetical protein [Oligoflexus sp.]